MWLYLVFWLLFLYFSTKLIKFVIYKTKIYQQVKDLPGPEIRVPLLFGHLSHFLSSVKSLASYEKYATALSINLTVNIRKYGNEHGFIRLWQGPFIPLIVPTDIKLARRLLINHFDKSRHYRILRHLFGADNFFSCNESKYKNYRAFLSPHFKINALDTYMPNTMDNLGEFNRRIDAIIDQQDGCFSNASKLVSSFVFQTLAGNLLSIQFDSKAKMQNVPHYIETMYDIMSIISLYGLWSQLFKWRTVTIFMICVHHFLFLPLNQLKSNCHFLFGLTKMVFEVHGRLKNCQNSQPEAMSLLESLVFAKIIQKKSYFDKFCGYLNIVNHMAMFAIGGFITTTAAITDILYYLAKYPHIQKKLANEIDSFQRSLIASDEEMSCLNLKTLHYMNAVIRETLRLNPAFVIGRMTSCPEMLNDTMTIPASVDVLVSLPHILQNDKYFHEPERFYPERFLKQTDKSSISNKKDYSEECDVVKWCTEAAHIPFSVGTRLCPGRDYALMQIKLFLVNFLSKYSIELHGDIDNYSVKQYAVAYVRNFDIKFSKRF